MTTVLEALNQALHTVMNQDERVVFIGEDILDPYGGAFKVARGLSTRFSERVMPTPISEAAIVGMATGMALRGLRPVAEIMFGDFLMLAGDQLLNHAAKFRWMYNDQVRVPLVIRTPMGGRRGYGPTHSQSIEKHWLGVPGLRVVAPNTLTDPSLTLEHAIVHDDDPVLFIEHKLLYGCTLHKSEDIDFQVRVTNSLYPTATVSLRAAPRSDLTFVCYGYMFELVRAAMLQLVMEYEIFSEAVVYTQLSPFHPDPLEESLQHSRRLLTVEEGARTSGWGSEVVSRMSETLGNGTLRAVGRVAAMDLPVASTRVLEEHILPSAEDIVQSAWYLARGS